MTRYELFKEAQKSGLYQKMIGAGIISLSMSTKLTIYESYLKLIEEGNDPVLAIEFAAEDCRVSTKTVYRIRQFMLNE